MCFSPGPFVPAATLKFEHLVPAIGGVANFAPAWDRKAATIRTSSTWWRPPKASYWRRSFCSRSHGTAALGFARGPGSLPAAGSAHIQTGGGVVQGPSFAAGDRFPEDLRVGVANAEGARRPFLPTLRLRARSKPPLAAADGRTSTAQPGVLKPWEFQLATNKVISPLRCFVWVVLRLGHGGDC